METDQFCEKLSNDMCSFESTVLYRVKVMQCTVWYSYYLSKFTKTSKTICTVPTVHKKGKVMIFRGFQPFDFFDSGNDKNN